MRKIAVIITILLSLCMTAVSFAGELNLEDETDTLLIEEEAYVEETPSDVIEEVIEVFESEAEDIAEDEFSVQETEENTEEASYEVIEEIIEDVNEESTDPLPYGAEEPVELLDASECEHINVAHSFDKNYHWTYCQQCGKITKEKEKHALMASGYCTGCSYRLNEVCKEHLSDCKTPDICHYCCGSHADMIVQWHSYSSKYTDLGNGTHSRVCSVCGDTSYYIDTHLYRDLNGQGIYSCYWCGATHTCKSTATYYRGANTHKLCCAECGGYFYQREGEHVYVNGKCSVCGQAQNCEHMKNSNYENVVYKKVNDGMHVKYCAKCNSCMWDSGGEQHTLPCSVCNGISPEGSDTPAIFFETGYGWNPMGSGSAHIDYPYIKAKESVELKVSVVPEGTPGTLVWGSENTKVATVDENGTATGVTYGTTYITCSLVQGGKKVATAKIKIVVNFNDIDELSSTFQKAIKIMADWGIVKGYDNGAFGQADTCTRKQFVIMLYRFAGKPAASGAMKFNDCPYEKTSDSYKAILWASKIGVIKGYDDGTFRPDNTVTRQQVMIMLYRYYRYLGKPFKASGSMKFTDVTAKPGSDTYNAILWGSQKGVTAGTSDTTFSPHDGCLRRQIALFFYRCHFNNIIRLAGT